MCVWTNTPSASALGHSRRLTNAQRERLEWVSQTLPPSRAHKQSPGRGEARQASGGARFMWRDRVFWVTAQCSHSPRQHHTESIKHDGWPIIIYLFGDFSMLSHSAKHVQEEGGGGWGAEGEAQRDRRAGGEKKKTRDRKSENGNKKKWMGKKWQNDAKGGLERITEEGRERRRRRRGTGGSFDVCRN